MRVNLIRVQQGPAAKGSEGLSFVKREARSEDCKRPNDFSANFDNRRKANQSNKVSNCGKVAGAGGLMEATFENKEFRRGFNSLQNFEGEGFCVQDV